MPTPAERMEKEYAALEQTTGAVIREWIELELLLAWLLVPLLGVDEFRSRVIWESIGTFRGRWRFLMRLGEAFVDDAVLFEFRQVMHKVKKIASNRNMLAHAHGGVGERVNELVFCWDDEHDEFGFTFLGTTKIQIGNVKQWVKDISDAKNEVMDLRRKLFASVYTLSKMHREPRSDHALSTDHDPERSKLLWPQPQLGSSEG